MDRYVVERSLPHAGLLAVQELREISCKSEGILDEMSDDLGCLEICVTEDELRCSTMPRGSSAIGLAPALYSPGEESRRSIV
ncbi:hypothetical protein QF026_001760 [Streptomyces aurantiacus]|uniref:hypothetical protein n=1 Tax=Streptomyces aurantiacus TaxID=47760 RepID=UPI0027904B35|nr:hypothetical protein [Streptomyces aurantiacus]MDQ0773294.1 hypothetical protein [Streptomyces aurantiacus]